jgi:putative peptide zinc metalloprotease protein
MKIYGGSEVTWRSHVSEIAKRNRDDIPPELSNTGGGEVAAKQDPKTGQVKPLSAVYEVIIPIDNAKLELQPGQRGFAKIDGGTHTLGWWLWRLLTKTFYFTI